MSRFNGNNISFEIYGASHAPEIGIKVWGLPTGVNVDTDKLQKFLARRAPGSTPLGTPRKEPDEPVFLTGITDSITDGHALHAIIRNTNVRKNDYANLRNVPRPGHADFAARAKYGRDFDLSGGGPFSARMTAPLCILGGICLQMLEGRGIEVSAKIVSIGGKDDGFSETILAAKDEGDSVGGVIECTITGMPAGFGGELFDGVEGLISRLVYAIPAVKGIEFGAGFKASTMKGSENNDAFIVENGRVATATNNHGGILGGITSGMPIVFRAAFKPTPSIALEQNSVDLDTLEPAKLVVQGRHDPCVVVRAVPVVEAAAAIAAVDLLLGEKSDDLKDIRRQIDCIDAQMIELYNARVALCRGVAEYKIKNNLPTLDANRENAKLEDIRAQGGEDAAELYKEIFRLSRAGQDRIKKEHE